MARWRARPMVQITDKEMLLAKTVEPHELY